MIGHLAGRVIPLGDGIPCQAVTEFALGFGVFGFVDRGHEVRSLARQIAPSQQLVPVIWVQASS